MSKSLIPSFVCDVSESLRLLTKNAQMSESLIFLSKSLIRSFFGKRLANLIGKPMSKSQPCNTVTYPCGQKYNYVDDNKGLRIPPHGQ